MAAARVEITRSGDLHTNTGQTEDMVRMGAIIDKSSICASGVFVLKSDLISWPHVSHL